jgi:hypothetical protein
MPSNRKASSPEVVEGIFYWRGSVAAAADALGMRPKNLRERLGRLGIEPSKVRNGEIVLTDEREHLVVSTRDGETVVRLPRMTRRDPPHPSDPYDPSRPVQHKVTRMTPHTQGTRAVLSRLHGPKVESGPYQNASQSPNLPAMEQAASTLPEEQSPIRTIKPKSAPIRLEPKFQDRLREARRAVAARYGAETSETVILNQFFEETFDGWLRSKLAPASAPKKPKGDK